MKKQILAVMCVVALVFVAGCEKPEETRAREESQRAQRLQANTNRVVESIQYIKDTRTGLCFAYCSGGAGYGGPTLATVPCEAVPPQLLTVAK